MKLTTVVSLAAICLGGISLTAWLLSTTHAKSRHRPTATSPPLDAVMEDVEIKQFDKTGQLTQILTVSQWQHRQGAESAEWKAPYLKLFQQNGIWNLSAAHGTSLQKKLWGHIDEMHLSQNIQLQHIPHNGTSDWILKTEYLLLLPDAKLAQTPNTVWIEGPWMQTKAQGLKADLNRETIQFNQTVDSQYTFADKME